MQSNWFKITSKNANVRNILAIAIVVLCFGFLFALIHFTIPALNSDILKVAAGVVLSTIQQVVQYFFGSSKDKSDDDKADRESTSAQ